MDNQPPTLSLCCCGSWDEQWHQESLILPSFTACKAGPPWKWWWCCGESVWECFCCSSWKEDCCCNNRQWKQCDQMNERWRIGRWPCAAAHMLNRVIKNTMNRVENNSSVDCFQGSWEQCEVQPNTSEGKGRKRGIKKINDCPETKVELHLHMCVNDILEEKWDKLCEMKEEIRKGCCWKWLLLPKNQWRSHW